MYKSSVNIQKYGTLGTLLEKLKNKMEMHKYNLQNDFEKGPSSTGPHMEFVNIFDAFSEITYKDLKYKIAFSKCRF